MANTLPTTMEYFDNLLGEQLTEGGGSGGGGSSDFSTAEVTINAPESMELSWESCPVLDETSNLLTGEAYADTFPAVFTVPLYNGKCVWNHAPRNLTLSGNIEELYEGDAMLITGDCTITISSQPSST